VIYLDTSALAKLVVEEAESADLARWLDARSDDVLCTSTITKVELVRAATRRSPQTRPAALALIAELALVPVDTTVVDTAWSLEPPELRSLDAIQLASALALASQHVTFVTYDRRLADAATAAGLDTASPGPARNGRTGA
jgi:predicted nucleic acid-binding protein